MRLRTANNHARRAYIKAHKGIGRNRWRGPMRKKLERYFKRQGWRDDMKAAITDPSVKIVEKPASAARLPEHSQDGGPMHAHFLNTRHRSQATQDG